MGELILAYDEESGTWGMKKEPYATIEVETEKDFNDLQDAVKKAQPAKPSYEEGRGYFCECGRLVTGCDAYCADCGQRIDWEL